MIGILGGGQLGRMLALAALELGERCRFLDPQPGAPAAAVAEQVPGAYDDERALGRLAECALVTYEFENVPLDAVRWLEARTRVWPPSGSLGTGQDRLEEKTLFSKLGIPTAPFRAVSTAAQLEEAVAAVGVPALLKTRRLGYDGKGQHPVRSAEEAATAWDALGRAPCLLEGLVRFQAEASVVAVRGASGEVAFWPLTENLHRGGVLRRSVAGAPDHAARHEAAALRHARALLEQLGHVGVLTLELFLTENGLLANELAPRVHNSGHWTLQGAATSQFENHLRAGLGLPLGSTALLCPTAMVNVVGEHADRAAVLAVPGARLHDYGKGARPGRKLGHVNLVAPTQEALAERLAALEPRVPFVLRSTDEGESPP